MTATKRLYRIVRESYYHNGVGHEELQGTEVLYCGYDRLEAALVYHGSKGTGQAVPGHYFSVIKAQSKAITEE